MSTKNEPKSTSSELTHEPVVNGLMPQFVTEAFTTLTVTFRTARKVAEGIERTVDGIDDIATVYLSQQKSRLLAERDAA